HSLAAHGAGTGRTHCVDELLGTVSGGDRPIHRGRPRTRRPGISPTAVPARLHRFRRAGGRERMVAKASPLWSGGVSAAVVHYVASTQRNGDRCPADPPNTASSNE